MENYPELCSRTLSPNFFAQRFSKSLMLSILEDVEHTGNLLDAAKKALFYGKETTSLQQPDDPQTDVIEIEDVDVFHGIVGAITESAELATLAVGMLTNKPVDHINLQEELGDLLWYIGIICNYYGFSVDDLMEKNIKKLQKRYPDKFTSEDALNRDTVKELDHY